ncbi:hypothetical protein K1X12_06350 [Hyphomonas sp. WL0036]|uniref:Swt1 family HEPN domain-containing protein n=1 Tax=Hyphomonas sediminis TaxID=2866160 RepID=UPI001C7EACDA|nr:Swt1 family HEPN domain-containing protein [Hyphomonas sediminis]MBY9066511.1 hypothetical protein [Hyphomonas sediminis]
MSGAQIAADIEQVETRYQIELGFRNGLREARQLENYDQFESAIRSQASEMSEYYEIFFCLENSIRTMISRTLQDAEEGDWWDTDRVDPAIKKEVQDRINKESEAAMTARSENKIDYTTFGELAVLINKNWDIFEPLFTTRSAVQRVLFQLNHLRNPIAHCCPLAEDEKDRLRLTVKDWFRIIA